MHKSSPYLHNVRFFFNNYHPGSREQFIWCEIPRVPYFFSKHNSLGHWWEVFLLWPFLLSAASDFSARCSLWNLGWMQMRSPDAREMKLWRNLLTPVFVYLFIFSYPANCIHMVIGFVKVIWTAEFITSAVLVQIWQHFDYMQVFSLFSEAWWTSGQNNRKCRRLCLSRSEGAAEAVQSSPPSNSLFHWRDVILMYLSL